jgi:hypothetical protein
MRKFLQINYLLTRAPLFTVMIAAMAIFVGVWQFESSQRRLKELEFQKIRTQDSLLTEERLREKKIEVYSKISESVGAILADDKIDSVLQENIYSFTKIYYGQALMIEDSSVNKMMRLFRDKADDYCNYRDTDKLKMNNIGMALCDTLKKAIGKNVYR